MTASIPERKHYELLKWAEPIRIRLVGTGSSAVRPLFENAVEVVANSTRHSISIVGLANANALFVIGSNPFVEAVAAHRSEAAHYFLGEERDLERFVARAQDQGETCAGFQVDNKGEIKKSIGFIAATMKKKDINICVNLILGKIIGLSPGKGEIKDSAFGEIGRHTDLTASDVVALRVLYDQRLAPGIALKAATDLAHAVIADHMGAEPGKIAVCDR